MATLNVTQSPYSVDDTGSTDAAAGIQSALDDAGTGDTVYLPTGTYLLDNGAIPLNIEETEDGVTLQGDGPGQTTLQMAGGFSSNHRGIRVDSSGDSSGSLTDITLRDFTIDGNRTNQSSSNGIGVAFYLGGGSDSGLLVENIRSQNWTNSGIQITRGATARYCDGINNGSHGIATQGGNSQGGNLIEWCEAWNNGEYGFDLHGLGTLRDSYSHDNTSGFKNGDASTTGNYTYQRIRVENCTSIGYQATETFSQAIFEDISIVGTDSWGMRIDNGGDIYIRGDGILCENVNRDNNNVQGVGFYSCAVQDEGGVTSNLRVDTVGSGGKPAVGLNGGNSGNIDNLLWRNASQAIVDFGGTLTFDSTTQGSVGTISNLPTDGETGTEGFGGGSGGGGGGSPSTSGLNGTLYALQGSIRTENGAAATSSGETIYESFENGISGWTAQDYTVVDESSLPFSAVHGTIVLESPTGNFQGTQVDSPDGKTFDQSDNYARVYFRVTETGTILRNFVCVDVAGSDRLECEIDGTSLTVREVLGGSTGSSWGGTLSSAPPVDTWWYMDIFRDDGTLGLGGPGYVRVEVRDDTGTQVGAVDSGSAIDTGLRDNGGIGHYVSDVSSDPTYFDYWHDPWS